MLLAAAAGYEGEAAVATIAHIMRQQRLSPYDATLGRALPALSPPREQPPHTVAMTCALKDQPRPLWPRASRTQPSA